MEGTRDWGTFGLARHAIRDSSSCLMTLLLVLRVLCFPQRLLFQAKF